MHETEYNPTHELDNDVIAAEIGIYERKRATKEKTWGNISKFIILGYVFLGGGYEIVMGIAKWHIQSSFIFSFMSCLIFVCRIMYAHYSGATRTMWSDFAGAGIMLILLVLHVVINGTFL